MFHYGKGGRWRRQFRGVSGLNFFHGPSVNIILGHILLIENCCVTLHKLLLGFPGGTHDTLILHDSSLYRRLFSGIFPQVSINIHG